MYLREKDSDNGPSGSPYYIGKGKNNRSSNKKVGEIKPPKDRTFIRFITENISEDEAFMWEEFWISYFGRIDLGNGCLHNRTNGGNGTSGILSSKKGKTFIELYGKEEAERLKQIASEKSKADFNSELSKRLCIHCNKILDRRNYAQHHGDKCKLNPHYVAVPRKDYIEKPNISLAKKGKPNMAKRKLPNEIIYEIGRLHLSKEMKPTAIAEKFDIRFDFVYNCSVKFKQEVLFGPHKPKI